jgi:hypothetical protein
VAQPYVSGGVSIFVGVASTSGGPVFLGHGERAPRPRVHRHYVPYFSDLGGSRVPFDVAHAGESGSVSVVLDRWNESVLRVIEDAATTGRAGNLGVRGTNDPGEMGTLMVSEGVAYPLWLRYEFAGRPTMNIGANGVMRKGWHFLAAFLDQVDDFEDLGLQPHKVLLTWTCLRLFDPTAASTTSGYGKFALYDEDMSAVANLPIN